MPRSARLNHESAKRQSERPARAKVRADALEAAGHRCSAVDIVPEIVCGGPLDVDEIKSRGVNPGGHLDPTNVQVLCRLHHTWRTEHPEEARNRGLRLASWETRPESPETGNGPTEVVLAVANGPVHVGPDDTFSFMCRAIEMPDGTRFYSAQTILDAGYDIPADALAKATEALYPTDEPFPYNACFCAVDAESICDGLGWAFTIDDIGDHAVTGA